MKYPSLNEFTKIGHKTYDYYIGNISLIRIHGWIRVRFRYCSNCFRTRPDIIALNHCNIFIPKGKNKKLFKQPKPKYSYLMLCLFSHLLFILQ